MNLGSMKTSLKRFGFDDSDPLDSWINAALHDFEDANAWTFLETIFTGDTTPASDTLVGPTNLWKLHTARVVTESQKLIYISRTVWEDQIVDPTAPGLPTHFTMVGLDTILLWPVPDTVYSLRLSYTKSVPELIADVDIPDVPARYHFAIVQRAAAIALQAENNEDRATTAQNQYDSVVARAIQSSSDHQTATLGQVQDTQEYN